MDTNDGPTMADLTPDVFARVRRGPPVRRAVLAAVFTGGFVGGLARYGITLGWPTSAYSFPWATFLVNTGGAFALALLLVLVIEVLPPTRYVRPALGTGFLGAFTTFSSVATAVDQFVVHERGHTAAIYLGASTVAGLAAAALGLVVGRAVAAFRHRSGHAGR